MKCFPLRWYMLDPIAWRCGSHLHHESLPNTSWLWAQFKASQVMEYNHFRSHWWIPVTGSRETPFLGARQHAQTAPKTQQQEEPQRTAKRFLVTTLYCCMVCLILLLRRLLTFSNLPLSGAGRPKHALHIESHDFLHILGERSGRCCRSVCRRESNPMNFTCSCWVQEHTWRHGPLQLPVLLHDFPQNDRANHPHRNGEHLLVIAQGNLPGELKLD